MTEILVQRLPHSEGLELPAYQTSGSAALDLLAALTEDLVLPPGEMRLVPTGLKIAIPEGFEVQVRPRSGLALKHGLIVPNSPGTIDSDYRGEVQVILANLGHEDFVIQRGMRIAQAVLARVERALLVVVEELPSSERGAGGFGHTGV
ncbi:MAG: dUTP diphosphatase [Candidatus Delongbacteria bacterium]|nr:dUTP diphosphatase [Candidatus Delongbacteria bacterium]